MADQSIHVVTGAFGYSGKYIAQRLLADGRTVMTLTNSVQRANDFAGAVEHGRRECRIERCRHEVDMQAVPGRREAAVKADPGEAATGEFGDEIVMLVIKRDIADSGARPPPGQPQPGEARHSTERRDRPHPVEAVRQKAGLGGRATVGCEQRQHPLQRTVELCRVDQISVVIVMRSRRQADDRLG